MADPNATSFNPVNMFAMLRDLINNNVPILTISGAPTSGTSGSYVGLAGPGAILIDYTNGTLYYNNGTLLSPTWAPASPEDISGAITVANGVATLNSNLLQRTSGTISAANIIGTTAGQFGHAAGVVLAPAPAAGLALQLISVGMYYTFGVAAYTAGGNITVNWGSGGAALTGLVSAANSVGNAASKALFFVPLSTVAIPIVSAVSLNLVSSAAFTNPGTATGTIAWECWYRTMTVGF